MTWSAPEIDRAADPSRGDEREILAGWLDYHRDTLSYKCAGLTGAQLKTASVEPSNLTLLGLVRHLTEIERWFRGLFTGEEWEELYTTEQRPEAPFTDVDSADAAANLTLWRSEIELTRKAVYLRDLGDTYEDEGEVRSLRADFLHVIEEYARHNGHADLIRERIDGAIGT